MKHLYLHSTQVLRDMNTGDVNSYPLVLISALFGMSEVLFRNFETTIKDLGSFIVIFYLVSYPASIKHIASHALM